MSCSFALIAKECDRTLCAHDRPMRARPFRTFQLDDDDGWSNGIFDDEGKVDFERKGVAFLACTIIMLNKPVVIPFSDLVCC